MRPTSSIRVRLSVLVGGLLALITLGYSGAAYWQVRSSALDATRARLISIGQEWSRFLTTQFTAAIAGYTPIVTSDSIKDFVSEPSAKTREAAVRFLASKLPVAGQRLALTIVAPDGHELLRMGDARPWMQLPGSSQSEARRGGQTLTTLGEMIAAGDTIVYPLTTQLIVDGAARGSLIEWRRLTIQPSPDQLNRLVGGTSLHIRLANESGTVWSDLEHPIAGPRIDPSRARTLLEYKDSKGESVYAAAVPVAGTPWEIVVESSHDELVELGRHFLDGLGILGTLALIAGVVGAYLLSGSLARPLARLTEAIETVNERDYHATTGLVSRRDEIGRLAVAFDGMVGRLQMAFSALTRSEERHRSLFESVPLPCWVFDRQTLRILAVNEAAVKRYGYTRNEFMSMTIAELRPAEDLPRLRAAVDAMNTGYERTAPPQAWRHFGKDGNLFDVEVSSHRLEFEGHSAVIAVVHDVSERARANERIERLEERYSRLIREAPTGVTFASLDGQILAVNPAFVSMLGYASEAEVMALDARALYAEPNQRAAIIDKMKSGEPLKREEIQLKRKDGGIITVQYSGRVVRDASTGEEYLEDTLEDVTHQRRVEQQFLQAQKMEAVGRLAGGIAHDFNNLLTVVLNYSDLLISDESLTEAQRDDVSSIRHAATSAAGLTRQLLVFSRQHVLQPKVLDVNDLIVSTGKLLHRLIGEDVELATSLDSEPRLVKADRGQLEQVIVNLAVNARDAMPSGGRLLIESGNVSFDSAIQQGETVLPAGDYVLLAVSDTGVGMDRETQARVFEPFFTTKEPGKGTGLGLSTVYGIVKQSNGFISLYTEPGVGTSFKIYLPRADDMKRPVAAQSASHSAPGLETILLVEDQADVRRVTQRILEQLGYRVLSAADADEAVTVIASTTERIDVLLTDVVLRGRSGRALAEDVSRRDSTIKVLFMSGYTDDAVVRHGVLEEGVQYLEKPFGPDALSRKIREVIDSDRTQAFDQKAP